MSEQSMPVAADGTPLVESVAHRFERISLEISLLGRDARADIEAKRASLDAAVRLSVDIEHAGARLHDEARRSRRQRVMGLMPLADRPLPDGMI